MDITRRAFLRTLALAGAGGVFGLGSCRGASGAAAASEAPTEFQQVSFFCFDTLCAIGGVMDAAMLQEAKQRCYFLEGFFSAHADDGDVVRINSAKGASVAVEPETARLIARSLDYSRESGGLFDITIGAVSLLWDFKKGIVPDEQVIAAALPHVDYRCVSVAHGQVSLGDPDARIDLGGIAKGFVADDLVAGFEKAGVASAYVNLGGNVKVLGPKADGSPWSIGVRDPEDARAVAATLQSAGGSMVTSGLYERRFERDGRAYWHILDPRTGYPANSAFMSASVYSRDSIDGEGITKPLFMMDEGRAMEYVSAHADAQGLLIRLDGSKRTTPGSVFRIDV